MAVAQLVFTILCFLLLTVVAQRLKEIFDLITKIDIGGLKYNQGWPKREDL